MKNPTPGWRPRPTDHIRSTLGLAFALACLAALPGAARADVATFAPTFTAGAPISTADFPYQSFVPGHLSAVSDPDGSGIAVLRYAVGNSDQPYPGAHPRADLLTRPWYTQGSTMFTSIPVKIPAGLTPFYDSRTSFCQFAEAKDRAASFPSWGLYVMADSFGRDHYFFATTPETGSFGGLWTGPVIDGGWHTFVVAAYYTARTGRGWLQLYMDGQPVTFNMGKFAGRTRATGVTTILDGATAWPLDINSYRSPGTLAGTLTTYHGAPKIGPTLASVIGGPAPAPGPTSVAASIALPIGGPASAPGPTSVAASIVPPIGPPSSVADARPLKARFTASPNTSAVGEKVVFDARSSTGAPVGYVWSNAQRTLGTGPTLTYAFRTAGTKRVRLTITAANGETSTVVNARDVLRKRRGRNHPAPAHRRQNHRHRHRAHPRRTGHPHRRVHHDRKRGRLSALTLRLEAPMELRW